MVASSVLTAQAALDIVTAAVDVQADYVADADDAVTAMQRPQMLLSRVAASLSVDVATRPADQFDV